MDQDTSTNQQYLAMRVTNFRLNPARTPVVAGAGMSPGTDLCAVSHGPSAWAHRSTAARVARRDPPHGEILGAFVRRGRGRTGTQRLRWNTAHDGPRGHIVRHDGAGRDRGLLTDRHAGARPPRVTAAGTVSAAQSDDR